MYSTRLVCPPSQDAAQIAKKTRGKQPKWTDLHVLGAVQSIVRLPQASINGAKQKRAEWHSQLKAEFDVCGTRLRREHPTLDDTREVETWKARSGRTVAQNGQAGISACRKYHSHMEVVRAMKMTGNPTEDYFARCATGLYNGAIERSHCYDVTRNPGYRIGPEFPYSKTYRWLCDEAPNELNPLTGNSPDVDGDADVDAEAAHNETQQLTPLLSHTSGPLSAPLSAPQSAPHSVSHSAPPSDSSPASSVREHILTFDRHRRPKGVKAAKQERMADMEQKVKERDISAALSVFGSKMGSVGEAMVKSLHDRERREAGRAERELEHSKRELELKEKEFRLRRDKEEIESIKMLFNDSSAESVQYRNALRRRRLRELLEEERITEKMGKKPRGCDEMCGDDVDNGEAGEE